MKNLYYTILALLFIAVSTAFAQLETGDPAPSFQCTDDMGNSWNSDDYYGSKVIVLYFYPAAMTGGCTKQACSFRDDKSELDKLGAMVVGISGDDVENLKYFKEAHNLNFPLLSDPDGQVAGKFGVPVRDGGSIVRNIGGSDITLERGITTSRWTFIIDQSGKVVYKNTEVDAEADSKNTIAVIKNL